MKGGQKAFEMPMAVAAAVMGANGVAGVIDKMADNERDQYKNRTDADYKRVHGQALLTAAQAKGSTVDGYDVDDPKKALSGVKYEIPDSIVPANMTTGKRMPDTWAESKVHLLAGDLVSTRVNPHEAARRAAATIDSINEAAMKMNPKSAAEYDTIRGRLLREAEKRLQKERDEKPGAIRLPPGKSTAEGGRGTDPRKFADPAFAAKAQADADRASSPAEKQKTAAAMYAALESKEQDEKGKADALQWLVENGFNPKQKPATLKG
jgi:hypothetical protein